MSDADLTPKEAARKIINEFSEHLMSEVVEELNKTKKEIVVDSEEDLLKFFNEECLKIDFLSSDAWRNIGWKSWRPALKKSKKSRQSTL